MTTRETLEALGVDAEAIMARAVDEIASQVLGGDWGDIEHRLSQQVQERMEIKTQEITEAVAVPMIESLLTTMVIQKTDAYGNPKGEQVPVQEYIDGAAERYLTEIVNWRGETCSARDRDGMPRIVQLVDKFMADRLRKQVAGALETLSEKFSKQVGEAVTKTMLQAMEKVDVKVGGRR